MSQANIIEIASEPNLDPSDLKIINGLVAPIGVRTPCRFTAAFVQRLSELGWIDGRTVRIEYRWGDGRNERFAKFADELVQLNVDVIVTGGAAIPAAMLVAVHNAGFQSIDGVFFDRHRQQRLVGQRRCRA